MSLRLKLGFHGNIEIRETTVWMFRVDDPARHPRKFELTVENQTEARVFIRDAGVAEIAALAAGLAAMVKESE